jgi:D-alanyl-D-alanine carboxypeptidase (penicillin-binding protein 5/6)
VGRAPHPAARARRWTVGLVALAVTSALASAPGLVVAQSLSPPPPTPVPVPGGGTSPSPFPNALQTPVPPIAVPPPLDAESALLVDLDTGKTLYALDVAEQRAIASLTKIMTAHLVLSRTSPAEIVTVSEEAASGRQVGISSLGLVAGEQIPVRELLYALLLQSANDAAVALAEHVAGSVEAFVEMMNRTAARLGMARTAFASPNGLDDAGYSTARDLARLTRVAYRHEEFGSIVSTRTHEIPAPDGAARVIQNRNVLLWLYPGALGVKTGFTTAAGFCIVATAEREGERLLAVILGENGEPFSEAAALLNYGFAAFERRTVIEAGDPVRPVEIGGREVTVLAGASLERLMPVDAGVAREIRLDPGVRFPPGRGQQVGVLVLSVDGGPVLGEVPLLVSDVPPPPPLEDGGSWWSRAFGAVVDAGAGLFEALFS